MFVLAGVNTFAKKKKMFDANCVTGKMSDY